MTISSPNEPIFSGNGARRYDLDWLRVIAFGLLIFYHIGMFYVTWGFHVKSVYAGPAAEPYMLIINPWRLALLFFISGVAVRFASDKAVSISSFAASRAFRLGLPILFGIIVVVTPQTYFELRQAGLIESGYFAFWGNYLNLEQLYPMITPTWNHLWYVVYLLVYILLLAPILPLLKRFAEGSGGKMLAALTGGPARLLILITIPFILYELLLEPHYPHTHALVDDWANHAHRFTIFMLGYFAAKNEVFWRAVARALPAAAALVIVLAVAGFLVEAYESQLSQSWLASVPYISQLIDMLDVLYAWSFIVLLLGLGQRFLNRPSKALTYLTGAVFCYYILHQTITIAAGYYLTQMALGAWTEFALVMAATIVGCVAGYEIVRRIPYLRLFFGVKVSPKNKQELAPAPATA